jgi:hypothetical protein
MLMTTMIYLKALGVWVLFAGAALVCRIVLDQSLMVYMSVQRAHQLSTLTLCVLCELIIVRFVRWTGQRQCKRCSLVSSGCCVPSWRMWCACIRCWAHRGVPLLRTTTSGAGDWGALVFVIQAVSPYLLTKRAPCFSWVVTPPQCGPARMEMHNGSESGYHAGIARKGWL